MLKVRCWYLSRHLSFLLFTSPPTQVWWVFVAASLATCGNLTVQDVSADAAAGIAYIEAHASDYNISANVSTYLVVALAFDAVRVSINMY